MRPLAPAVAELRWTGASLAACGLALGGLAVAGPGAAAHLRAGALGLAGSLLVLWVLWGARAARRAIRLALPVRPRWALEDAGSTVARVLLARTLPLAALAVAGASAGAGRVAGTAGLAAGVLTGAGVAALLAAARLRRAERALGRRLLGRARWVRVLDRRALFLEPTSPADRPAGPWPAHRPPARVQRAVIELNPANPAPRHPVGVRTPRDPRPQRPPGPGS